MNVVVAKWSDVETASVYDKDGERSGNQVQRWRMRNIEASAEEVFESKNLTSIVVGDDVYCHYGIGPLRNGMIMWKDGIKFILSLEMSHDIYVEILLRRGQYDTYVKRKSLLRALFTMPDGVISDVLENLFRQDELGEESEEVHFYEARRRYSMRIQGSDVMRTYRRKRPKVDDANATLLYGHKFYHFYAIRDGELDAMRIGYSSWMSLIILGAAGDRGGVKLRSCPQNGAACLCMANETIMEGHYNTRLSDAAGFDARDEYKPIDENFDWSLRRGTSNLFIAGGVVDGFKTDGLNVPCVRTMQQACSAAFELRRMGAYGDTSLFKEGKTTSPIGEEMKRRGIISDSTNEFYAYITGGASIFDVWIETRGKGLCKMFLEFCEGHINVFELLSSESKITLKQLYLEIMDLDEDFLYTCLSGDATIKDEVGRTVLTKHALKCLLVGYWRSIYPDTSHDVIFPGYSPLNGRMYSPEASFPIRIMEVPLNIQMDHFYVHMGYPRPGNKATGFWNVDGSAGSAGADLSPNLEHSHQIDSMREKQVRREMEKLMLKMTMIPEILNSMHEGSETSADNHGFCTRSPVFRICTISSLGRLTYIGPDPNGTGEGLVGQDLIDYLRNPHNVYRYDVKDLVYVGEGIEGAAALAKATIPSYSVVFAAEGFRHLMSNDFKIVFLSTGLTVGKMLNKDLIIRCMSQKPMRDDPARYLSNEAIHRVYEASQNCISESTEVYHQKALEHDFTTAFANKHGAGTPRPREDHSDWTSTFPVVETINNETLLCPVPALQLRAFAAQESNENKRMLGIPAMTLDLQKFGSAEPELHKSFKPNSLVRGVPSRVIILKERSAHTVYVRGLYINSHHNVFKDKAVGEDEGGKIVITESHASLSLIMLLAHKEGVRTGVGFRRMREESDEKIAEFRMLVERDERSYRDFSQSELDASSDGEEAQKNAYKRFIYFGTGQVIERIYADNESFRFLDDGSFASYKDILSFPGGRGSGLSPFRRLNDDNWYGVGHAGDKNILFGQFMEDEHFLKKHEIEGPYRVSKRGDFCLRTHPTGSGSEYALKYYTRNVIKKIRRSLLQVPWFDRIDRLAEVANEMLIMTRSMSSESIFRGSYPQSQLSRIIREESSEWPNEVENLLLGYDYQSNYLSGEDGEDGVGVWPSIFFGERERLGEVSKASADDFWNRAVIHAAHQTKNVTVDLNCVQQYRNAGEARTKADVKFFAGIAEEISSPFGQAEVEGMFQTFPDLLKWRFGGWIHSTLSDVV